MSTRDHITLINAQKGNTMHLTPAQPGTLAIVSTERGGERHFTVQAWDHNGEAMVAAHEHPHLIQASKLGRVELGMAEPIAAVIPGGGWTRTAPCDDPQCLTLGHTHTEQVLAWIIQSNGDGSPVFASSEGNTYACERGPVSCEVAAFTPPGGWDIDTTAGTQVQA